MPKATQKIFEKSLKAMLNKDIFHFHNKIDMPLELTPRNAANTENPTVAQTTDPGTDADTTSDPEAEIDTAQRENKEDILPYDPFTDAFRREVSENLRNSLWHFYMDKA